MDKFYQNCGKLLGHHIQKCGSFPRTSFVACFQYQRGEAEFDGRVWTFRLFNMI